MSESFGAFWHTEKKVTLKVLNLWVFNFVIWWLKNISWVFNFTILVKIGKQVSLNIKCSIVDQCNCYQIWYRNSNFVTISRDMQYTRTNIIYTKSNRKPKKKEPVELFFL